jgi:hypothetical protein
LPRERTLRKRRDMLPLIIAGAAALGSAIAGGISSANAANALKQGEGQARQDIQKYTGQAAGYQEPYYQMGTQNAQTLSNMTNQGAFNVNPYSYQAGQAPGAYQQGQFNFQQDPGYQFQLQQGMNAIQGGAAAQGGLLSGGTLKALQKYGTGLANQSYNEAYNRYLQGQNLGMNVQNQAYGQYANNRNFGAQNAMNQYETQNQQANQAFGRYNILAGMGQEAGNNLSNIYNQAGANVANTDIGQANAGAAGIMGVGGAVSKGLNTIGQMGTNYGMGLYNQPQYNYLPNQTQQLSGMGFKYNQGNNSWTQ